jgi:hypothetical protein
MALKDSTRRGIFEIVRVPSIGLTRCHTRVWFRGALDSIDSIRLTAFSCHNYCCQPRSNTSKAWEEYTHFAA